MHSHNKERQITQEKLAKDLRHFSKYSRGNKRKNRDPASLVIIKMQIKITRDTTVILLKWLKWKSRTMPDVGEDLELKHSHDAGGCVY